MHLSDCFTDLIAFVASGVKEPRLFPGACESLAHILDNLIYESEEHRVAGGFSEEDYTLARFALLVWADESIMKSSYRGKESWSRYLLQRKYYKTTGGGVEFYRKLKSLDMTQNQVREVYFLCLALGYAGRYGMDGEDRIVRDRIKTLNLKHLTGSAEVLAQLKGREKVFPYSYIHDETGGSKGGKRSGWPSWATVLLGIAPVGVFAFLYVLYRFILDNEILAKVVQ